MAVSDARGHEPQHESLTLEQTQLRLPFLEGRFISSSVRMLAANQFLKDLFCVIVAAFTPCLFFGFQQISHPCCFWQQTIQRGIPKTGLLDACAEDDADPEFV